MESFLIVYITCSNLEQAKSIGKTVVEEKLAACANCIPSMQSIYMWKGSLQEDNEVILILKTTSKRISELEKRVKELHSYETPCIIYFKLDGGSKEYLDWISEMTQ